MTGEVNLKQAATKVERLNIEVEILPMVSGDPASVILEMQKKVEAGAIVMGSRGVPSSSKTPPLGAFHERFSTELPVLAFP